MAAERWRRITDQQQHQRTDLWASGAIVLAAIVFSCHYIDQFVMGEGLIMSRSQQRACTSFHRFLFMVHDRHKCCVRSGLLTSSWENLILLNQKTWFFLSSLIHTKCSPLHSWNHHCCAPLSSACRPLSLHASLIHLCGFCLLSSYSPSPLCTDFLMRPFSPSYPQ